MAYKEIPKQNKGMIQTFRGLNAHERVGDGEWTDMLNMSADEYPVEKTRKRRKIESDTEWKILHAGVATQAVKPIGIDYIITQYKLENGGAAKIRAYPSGREVTATLGLPQWDSLYNAWYYTAVPMIDVRLIDEIENLYIVQEEVPVDTMDGKPVQSITLEDGILIADDTGKIKAINYGVTFDGADMDGSGMPFTQMIGFNRKVFTNAGVIADATGENRNTVYCGFAMGSLESSLEPTVELVNGDGVINYTDEKPQTPTHGEYYYDSVTQGLYVYNDIDEDWHAVTTCWTRITINGSESSDNKAAVKAALERLHEGDLLQVGGIYHNGSNYGMMDTAMSVISMEPNSYRITLNGLIYCEHMDYIAAIRRMPKLDYICEHENRVFGCRFGQNDEGKFVNEVYASALGDQYNWFLFEGTEADSWVSGVGAPGPWTGCCECGEYVFFFKEDIIYVLSGNGPSSFRLTPFNDFGVQQGSEQSLTVNDNQAYYKSVHGVRRISPYSYSTKISALIGEDKWKNAVGGTDGQKYYVRMEDKDTGERSVFVYDEATRVWTVEDEPATVIGSMVRYKNNLLAVGAEGNGADYDIVYTYMNAENAFADEARKFFVKKNSQWVQENKRTKLTDEGAFEWYGETGPMGLEEPGEKRIKSIQIRLKADAGTALRVQVQYDESGEWHEIAREIRGKRGTFRIAYTPQRRCDTFRLRFEGKGDCIIYSIAIHAEDAGDSVG